MNHKEELESIRRHAPVQPTCTTCKRVGELVALIADPHRAFTEAYDRVTAIMAGGGRYGSNT